ncbi:hypothetical protein, partial [Aeromonas salmonicida]|uniref:hypothetical protein n=1 Tax=Aeromonas salmonicida TaxID=645 RepID=UPI003D323821
PDAGVITHQHEMNDEKHRKKAVEVGEHNEKVKQMKKKEKEKKEKRKRKKQEKNRQEEDGSERRV